MPLLFTPFCPVMPGKHQGKKMIKNSRQWFTQGNALYLCCLVLKSRKPP